jgi:predicted RNA binding protein YcfA (HicA-like mRNA interferase family)
VKLPRDVSGVRLARRLAALGYKITRQTGSHIRLTREDDTKHNVTVPRHKTLKIGTLNGILKDIAGNAGISVDELLGILF